MCHLFISFFMAHLIVIFLHCTSTVHDLALLITLSVNKWCVCRLRGSSSFTHTSSCHIHHLFPLPEPWGRGSHQCSHQTLWAILDWADRPPKGRSVALGWPWVYECVCEVVVVVAAVWLTSPLVMRYSKLGWHSQIKFHRKGQSSLLRWNYLTSGQNISLTLNFHVVN